MVEAEAGNASPRKMEGQNKKDCDTSHAVECAYVNPRQRCRSDLDGVRGIVPGNELSARRHHRSPQERGGAQRAVSSIRLCLRPSLIMANRDRQCQVEFSSCLQLGRSGRNATNPARSRTPKAVRGTPLLCGRARLPTPELGAQGATPRFRLARCAMTEAQLGPPGKALSEVGEVLGEPLYCGAARESHP